MCEKFMLRSYLIKLFVRKYVSHTVTVYLFVPVIGQYKHCYDN